MSLHAIPRPLQFVPSPGFLACASSHISHIFFQDPIFKGNKVPNLEMVRHAAGGG